MNKKAKVGAARAVLFARSNGDDDAIQRQIDTLTQYASSRGIRVAETIRLAHCSANDTETNAALTAILDRRWVKNIGMLLITDLLCICRRGLPYTMQVIKNLTSAGVSVVTPDLGEITSDLWNTFPLLPKGWKKWGKKNVVVPKNRKEPDPNAKNKKISLARNDSPANVRRRTKVQDGDQKPALRNGTKGAQKGVDRRESWTSHAREAGA